MSLLRFGPFVFDSATGELTARNRRTTLRPQTARVLEFLARRAGQLVTRDELNRELWGGETYVDFEHGLNLCIHEIRAALHDKSGSPTYVETLPRRGYRFIAPVENDPIEVQASIPHLDPVDAAAIPVRETATGILPGRRRVASFLGFAVSVVTIMAISSHSSTRETVASPVLKPQPASVALLTLEELGSKPDQEYFANGISWELQRQLEGVSTLRVRARRSVVPYNKSKKTAAVIGRELKVSNLVSGSLLRTGARIRLNVKLVETKTGAILWAESYDTTLADLLQVESQVARAITHTLDQGAAPRAVTQVAGTGQVNAEAHAALLKAMGAASPEEFERGLQQALAIDPAFELAWSMYASSELSDTWFAQSKSPMAGYPKAKDLALKALALDDADASAHTTLAAVKLHHEWDWPGAEREFRRAIELSPSNANAHHIYSHYLLTMDRLSESVAESRIASDLSPLDPNLSTCVGWHCLYARQYDDAIAECMKLINDEQANAITYYYLGRVYVRQGKFADGVAALEIAEKKSGGINSVLATLAYAYGRAGRRVDAERALAVLMDRAQRRYVAAFDIAVVYAGLGETDKTFEWLDRAFLERSTWLVHLKWDDRFTSIRSDPRMVVLLRRMGIPNPESVRQAETTIPARYSTAASAR